MSLRTPPILWVRQDRHFYFRFFLFWRKVSNATTNIPVATIKDATAKIVDTISYDVITPPPFLCIPVNWSLDSGGYHPVMGLLIGISYHMLNLSSIVFASFVIHFQPCKSKKGLFLHTDSIHKKTKGLNLPFSYLLFFYNIFHREADSSHLIFSKANNFYFVS